MPSTPTPPRNPRVLRDPRLVALLMYVTGKGPQDEDGRLAGRFAQAVADARALLNRSPLTTAFDDTRAPGAVAPFVLATMRRQAELRPLLEPLQRADYPDEGPITTTLETVRLLLDTCVDDALLRVACVMYCLLNDGAR